MSPTRSAPLRAAITEAIWGMVIADAVAMPVHWFYQIDEIKKRYNGWIDGESELVESILKLIDHLM